VRRSAQPLGGRKVIVSQNPEQLLRQVYAAFNARKLDAALELMCSEVVWPNGMEGGVVHGRSGIQEYWTRQWGMINPTVEPLSIRKDADGRFDVEVKQLVKSLDGQVLADRIVHHVYRLRDGLIASMEIVE
jgi:ketosteroid isomerase-like protein